MQLSDESEVFLSSTYNILKETSFFINQIWFGEIF